MGGDGTCFFRREPQRHVFRLPQMNRYRESKKDGLPGSAVGVHHISLLSFLWLILNSGVVLYLG